MKAFNLFILTIFFQGVLFAQQEFHIFFENHKTTPGTSDGDGSIQNPWDLQTALSQPSNVINGGDIIWLHKGI